MSKVFEVKSLVQEYVGVSPAAAASVIVALGAAGVVAGLLFPKFEATALLQFPEPQKVSEQRIEPKANLVELAAYKRMAASYDSVEQLREYVEGAGLAKEAAAARLIKQAEDPKFWNKSAVPVLPFSKQDQKQFGDIKDASATTLLGLELKADARTPEVAQQMVGVLGAYLTNAVMRERIRSWALAGKVESTSSEQGLRADIIKAQLDISLAERRIEDMKGVLKRHPEAVGMASRPAVNVDMSSERQDRSDRSDRFLPPVAQIVGAESLISYRREQIRRFEREARQKQVQAKFFVVATDLVDQNGNAKQLLEALNALSRSTFGSVASSDEGVKEATLRVDATLDGFKAMYNQFGVRNGVAVAEVASRDPVRLGALGLALGLGLLGGIAFLRVGLRSMREGDAFDAETALTRKV